MGGGGGGEPGRAHVYTPALPPFPPRRSPDLAVLHRHRPHRRHLRRGAELREHHRLAALAAHRGDPDRGGAGFLSSRPPPPAPPIALSPCGRGGWGVGG